jgi:hypothetical protein
MRVQAFAPCWRVRISERAGMLDARRTMFASNILDLALSYLGLLVVLVVVYPVLNKRLLDVW